MLHPQFCDFGAWGAFFVIGCLTGTLTVQLGDTSLHCWVYHFMMSGLHHTHPPHCGHLMALHSVQGCHNAALDPFGGVQAGAAASDYLQVGVLANLCPECQCKASMMDPMGLGSLA